MHSTLNNNGLFEQLGNILDEMKPKLQYRLNFQNSNHQEIVGSEWVDKPEDLLDKLLYFSNQGYFCKIQKRGE